MMEERIHLLKERIGDKIQLEQTNKNIPTVQGKFKLFIHKTLLDSHFLLKI
jgi:hypothetical protein